MQSANWRSKISPAANNSHVHYVSTVATVTVTKAMHKASLDTVSLVTVTQTRHVCQTLVGAVTVTLPTFIACGGGRLSSISFSFASRFFRPRVGRVLARSEGFS